MRSPTSTLILCKKWSLQLHKASLALPRIGTSPPPSGGGLAASVKVMSLVFFWNQDTWCIHTVLSTCQLHLLAYTLKFRGTSWLCVPCFTACISSFPGISALPLLKWDQRTFHLQLCSLPHKHLHQLQRPSHLLISAPHLILPWPPTSCPASVRATSQLAPRKNIYFFKSHKQH